MRKLMAWGGLAAVLLALSVAAGDGREPEESKDTRSRGWFSGWFGSGSSSKDRKTDAKKSKATTAKEKSAKKAEPSAKLAAPLDEAARRSLEEAAYFRRLDVCSRLLDVAERTNDAALRKFAEELEARVWDVYRQRAGGSAEDRLLEKYESAVPSGGKSTALRGDRP